MGIKNSVCEVAELGMSDHLTEVQNWPDFHRIIDLSPTLDKGNN